MADVKNEDFLDVLNLSDESIADNSDRLTCIKFSLMEDDIAWNSYKQCGFYDSSGNHKGMVYPNGFTIKYYELITTYIFIIVFYEHPKVAYYHVHNLRTFAMEAFAPIVGLRCRNNSLAIVQENRIIIYDYNNNDDHDDVMVFKGYFSAHMNPRVLYDFKNNMIAYAENNGGLIVLNTLTNQKCKLNLNYPREIVCLALNNVGSFLAISFNCDNVIHVWSVIHNNHIFKLMINETITSEVYNINFSADSRFLCYTTVNGEINIFKTDISENEIKDINFITKEVKAFSSFGTFANTPCICKFLTDDTVLVVSMNGIAQSIKYSETSISVLRSIVFFPG